MKQATFLAVCLLCLGFNVSANGNLNNAGTFIDSSKEKIISIHDVLQQVLPVVGLQTKFDLKEADVLNIEASVSRGQKLILYNASYIESLNKATRNNKWVLMTLLAHEIGHHLNGHVKRRKVNKHLLELEADEFAGYVMHKLGATLLQSQNVMFYIANTKGSETHPARDLRLLAIEKGWKKASSIEENMAAVIP